MIERSPMPPFPRASASVGVGVTVRAPEPPRSFQPVAPHIRAPGADRPPRRSSDHVALPDATTRHCGVFRGGRCEWRIAHARTCGEGSTPGERRFHVLWKPHVSIEERKAEMGGQEVTHVVLASAGGAEQEEHLTIGRARRHHTRSRLARPTPGQSRRRLAWVGPKHCSQLENAATSRAPCSSLREHARPHVQI